MFLRPAPYLEQPSDLCGINRAEPITSGLYLYGTGAGPRGALQDNVAARNGAYNGAATMRSTRMGNAVYLDGTTGTSVRWEHDANYVPPSLTWRGRFIFNSFTPAYSAIFNWTFSGNATYQCYVKSNGKLAFYLAKTALTSYDGTGVHTLVAGVEYDVAMVVDDTVGRLYINGVLDGTTGATNSGAYPAVTAQVCIGFDSGASGRELNAYFNNVSFHQRALSRAEILALSRDPWLMCEPRRIEIPVFATVAPIDIMSTETDAALALAGELSASVGLATETDAALVLLGEASQAVGLSIEADIALALTGVQSAAAGLAIETDAALALSGSASGAVGLATETDTALALTTAGTIGAADETDTALALSGEISAPFGLAIENDTALALVSGADVGMAAETDQAFALSGSLAATFGLALEINAAFALDGGDAPAALPDARYTVTARPRAYTIKAKPRRQEIRK